MQITNNGIELIKKFEGFRSHKYLDVGGKPTIGYGHLIKKGEGYEVIGRDKAEELLRQDIQKAEDAVKKNVKIELSDAEYSSLVSLVYNIGSGAFRRSTLLKRLNENKKDKVPAEMLRWHKVQGKPNRGLIRRRAAEANMFLS